MMKLSMSLLAATIMAGGAAVAQDRQRSGASDEVKLFELPSACQTNSGAGMTAGMGSMEHSPGRDGRLSAMTDAHRGYRDAMLKMQKPMMVGMMAKDPDVAWACAMIAHHSGAVEMSRVVLRSGDDAQVKKMAQKTISDQTKEIRELTEWLENQRRP